MEIGEPPKQCFSREVVLATSLNNSTSFQPLGDHLNFFESLDVNEAITLDSGRSLFTLGWWEI